MVKFAALFIGGLIAFEGARAYGKLGVEWNGILGLVLATLIFFVIQRGELEPVVMTGGQHTPLQMLIASIGGKKIDLKLVDPEEFHQASTWAFRCYVVDMIVGLFVWQPLKTARPLELLQSGAATAGDVNVGNIGMIIAVTFVLQECVAFYLRKGGWVPSRKKDGARNAN
jgi:hypothetical protein